MSSDIAVKAKEKSNFTQGEGAAVAVNVKKKKGKVEKRKDLMVSALKLQSEQRHVGIKEAISSIQR